MIDLIAGVQFDFIYDVIASDLHEPGRRLGCVNCLFFFYYLNYILFKFLFC